MRTTPVFLIGLLITANIYGQQPLSLETAQAQALANRKDLKVEQLNVQIAENEIKKVTSRNLPQLSSDLDVRWNTQLPSNVIPGEAFGVAGSPDRFVQFGTDWNSSWAFNLNQTLFDPAINGDKKIAQQQVLLNSFNAKATEAVIKQQVTEAYFTVLLWQERTALSESNLQRTKDILNTAVDQLQQGTITAYDRQKYQLDFANAEAEHAKNANNLQLSFQDLFYKMGLDTLQSIVLTDSLSALFVQLKNELLDFEKVNRPELQAQKIQQDIWKLNIRKQKMLYIPKISFYGNYTWQSLSDNANFFDSDNWFPFNYIGLNANIPIFDGLLKAKTKQEYQLRLQSSTFQYEKLEDDYQQQAHNALLSAKNAEADLQYQRQNLELANQLYQIDTDRLKNGTIKANDLATTSYTLRQTQTNYLNAAYNYLVAVVQFKKAIGSL
ncbi:MAG: TolC family protein [Chitinophagales bacterium]|nr:TolC family protein [Chitinophagales bacterium]